MKIAVTGANGYLGSAILSYLSPRHEVIGVSRSASGSSNDLVLNDLFVLSASHLRGVECVIHAAGVATTKGSKEVLQSGNVDLSRHVARVCLDACVSRMLNLSSVKACGERDVGPQVIDTPETEYGQSKLESERAIDAVLSGGEVQHQHIRLPLVYSRAGTNNFSKLVALSNSFLPLPIGSLSANRSYCCALNLLSYLDCVLSAESIEPMAYVADRYPMVLSRLLVALASVQGKRLRSLPIPGALFRSAVGLVSSGLAKQLLEDSKVDISETLRDMPSWEPMEIEECLEKEFGGGV